MEDPNALSNQNNDYLQTALGNVYSTTSNATVKNQKMMNGTPPMTENNT
ncbi:MAG TPA: hypothetical protein VE223_07410 [Nitrososphaeraceae archaeon]|nr:hypothetical protein [Nitrososphaeraceae archaeon]